MTILGNLGKGFFTKRMIKSVRDALIFTERRGKLRFEVFPFNA